MLVLLPLVGGVLWSAGENGDKEPDPDSLYRYNDGYIYQVDPKTQLISAVIQALT